MPTGQPPSYPQVTDADLLRDFQNRALEPRSPVPGPVTMTSGMWTVSELVGYLSYRQNRYLRETGIVVARSGYDGIGQDNSIVLTASEEVVNLPQNLIDALRLAFVSYDTSTPPLPIAINDIPREDFMSLDAYDQTWESDTAPAPIAFTQSITQTLQAFLAHAPRDVSAIDLTFVAFGAVLTGAGVALNVPPEITPFLTWGLCADAFAKIGEGYCPGLAEYAEMRFAEGIELGKALLAAPALQRQT